MLKAHAHRLVAHVPGTIRLVLANDPAEALRQHLGIHVVAVEQLRHTRGSGGWCDGVSFTTDRVICYAPSPGSRRQNFTLLHEYGHLLVDEDDAALDWLADRADPAADLERICDAIAAEVLLPTATVTQVLDGNAPAPGHLMKLHAASQASEEVCAIALAGRLPVRGAVVLVTRRNASVAFAASSGWPPLSIPRGLAIPARHPLRDLGIRQRWIGWTTPDFSLACMEQPAITARSRNHLMRAHAEAGSRRTTVVLLDVHALAAGGPVHHRLQAVSAARTEQQTKDRLICSICGQTGSSTIYPCEECGNPPCPACGRCQCL